MAVGLVEFLLPCFFLLVYVFENGTVKYCTSLCIFVCWLFKRRVEVSPLELCLLDVQVRLKRG